MLIDQRPVLTIIPASSESIPIYVCKNAVSKPDRIPAPIAASIARYGCPCNTTIPPTTAPRV